VSRRMISQTKPRRVGPLRLTTRRLVACLVPHMTSSQALPSMQHDAGPGGPQFNQPGQKKRAAKPGRARRPVWAVMTAASNHAAAKVTLTPTANKLLRVQRGSRATRPGPTLRRPALRRGAWTFQALNRRLDYGCVATASRQEVQVILRCTATYRLHAADRAATLCIAAMRPRRAVCFLGRFLPKLGGATSVAIFFMWRTKETQRPDPRHHREAAPCRLRLQAGACLAAHRHRGCEFAAGAADRAAGRLRAAGATKRNAAQR
jgi:hypothetical protein